MSRLAFGSLPLCSLVLARAKPWAGVRWRATAAVDAFGVDFAAVLGLRSRRRTRFVRCAHCAQTTAASQLTKRASTRTDRTPALLAAAQALHRTPAHDFAGHRQFIIGGRSQSGHRARLAPSKRACGARQVAGSMPAACPSPSLSRPIVSRKAWGRPVRGCVCDGEERSAGVGARTRALRQLTRRSCLSVTSAASAASSAARPQREYRSEPRAAGRRIRSPAPAGPKPCKHEPPASPVRFMRRSLREARWSR
jgi:hypothetical protein